MRIHFAILPAQHARQLACVREGGWSREKEGERERGECCSRVAVTGAVAGADTVAGLGANVFTPKRFRVHGDTLVWRPLTVNTYIWMCSYAQQIATPPLSSSLSLSLSPPFPRTCVKSSTLRCFGKMQTTRTTTTMRGGCGGKGVGNQLKL